MKFAIIALATLIAGFAHAEQDITIKGDKIAFQKDSAYVSALYSKSLCVAGSTFKANITKCAATEKHGDNDVCVKTVVVAATQPMKSTAQRCVAFSGHDQRECAKWETYALVQSPVRKITWENNNTVVKTATVTIPACK